MSFLPQGSRIKVDISDVNLNCILTEEGYSHAHVTDIILHQEEIKRTDTHPRQTAVPDRNKGSFT